METYDYMKMYPLSLDMTGDGLILLFDRPPAVLQCLDGSTSRAKNNPIPHMVNRGFKKVVLAAWS